ncbi:Gamma-tubulin complex component 5 [Haplosporangium gracile]|nr:Gamma-tubulin complex component 5 [Haplosporangium gracile]
MSKRRSAVLPAAGRGLVTHVTGFQPGQGYFDTCSEYVSRHLFDVNGVGGVQNKAMDHEAINKRVYGLAEKFSIKGQDQKAEALKGYQERLRGLARSVGEGDRFRTIATSSETDQEESAQNIVSSVLLLLLELSDTPTIPRKGEYGYIIPHSLRPTNAPKTQHQINKELWASILKDDPLVGDHWKQAKAGIDHQDGESSDSDFEDMDVNPRSVPVSVAENLDFASKENIFGKDRSKHVTSVRDTLQRDYGIWMHRDSASDLNSALQNSKDFVLAQSIPVMDEIDIIHEVFFLLQGLPTTIFALGQDESFKLSLKITTSHLSPTAVSAIVKPFQDSATVVRTLQALVDRICSASSQAHGKVIQMFASAIHSELIMFKEFVASIQRTYNLKCAGPTQRMASLIELEATLSGRLNLAHMLQDFIRHCDFHTEPSNNGERACSHSINVLSRLYSNVRQLYLCGDIQASAMFQRLLQQAIKPFLLNMERWLSGQPLDSESEFMFKLSPQVDIFSAQFWTDGYQIQAEIITEDLANGNTRTSTAQISPCFVPDLSLKQLLYAGKAMQISLALKSFEISILTATGFATAVSQRMFEESRDRDAMDYTNEVAASTSALQQDFPEYSTILERQYPLTPLSSLFSDTTRTSNLSKSDAAINFTWRMESELAKAIQFQYLSANTILKSLLFSQSRLQWHLRGMSEFFFMMQGEVMHLFAANIFSKMKRKRPWLDSYTLESTFHQVAAICDWEYASFVKLRVGEGKRSWTDFVRLKAQTLELIEFDYMLPWPLGGIFYSTENSKRMYSRITGLLFQVQTVKFAIEQSFFLKSKPPRTPELPTFWKLRMQFLSTMNDLWSYFMMTVLDVQIQKFQSQIEGQGDLDNMIRLSQRFIGTCYERCFLKKKTLPLHRSTPVRSTDELSSDSEEDSYDQEQDWNGGQVEKGYSAHDDQDHRTDEDIEMDQGESSSAIKKQRVDSNTTGFPRERSFQRREYRRTDASRKTSQGGIGSGSYRESLEAIEQEFNRCREFLAKSLQMVVNSNAVRGFAARQGGGQSSEQDARGEGDSDYLDGLILALLS